MSSLTFEPGNGTYSYTTEGTYNSVDHFHTEPARLLQRTPGGRVLRTIDINKWLRYLAINNKDASFVYELFNLANSEPKPTTWRASYAQAAPQLYVMGAQVFPQGSPGKLDVFMQTLNNAFHIKQKCRLSARAHSQLEYLSAPETLQDYVTNLLKRQVLKLWETEYKKEFKSTQMKIDFSPDTIPGVINISVTVPIIEVDASGASINKDSIENEIVFSLRGFYDDSEDHFVFPIYWNEDVRKHRFAQLQISGTVRETNDVYTLLQAIITEISIVKGPAEGKYYLSDMLAREYRRRSFVFSTIVHKPKNPASQSFLAFAEHYPREDALPKEIEKLFKLTNGELNSTWQNDYGIRGADSIHIDNVSIFPEGPGNEKVFKEKIKQALQNKRHKDFSDNAIQQLVDLTSISALPLFFTNWLMHLTKNFNIARAYNTDTIMLSIYPSEIDGVVDIHFNLGTFDPNGADKIKDRKLVKSSNSDPIRESGLRLALRIKGFYNYQTQRYDFPLYWRDMGFGIDSVAVEAKSDIAHNNQPRYIAFEEYLHYALLVGHNPYEPKWSLNKFQREKYMNRCLPLNMQRQRQWHLDTDVNKVLEYFPLSHEVSHRNKSGTRYQKICIRRAAELLRLAEHNFGQEEDKDQSGTPVLYNSNIVEGGQQINGASFSEFVFKKQIKILQRQDMREEAAEDEKSLMSTDKIREKLEEQRQQAYERANKCGYTIPEIDDSILENAITVTLDGRKPSAEVVHPKIILHYRIAQSLHLSQDFISFCFDLGKKEENYGALVENSLHMQDKEINLIQNRLRLVSAIIQFGKEKYPETFNRQGLTEKSRKRYRFSKPDEIKILEFAARIFSDEFQQKSFQRIVDEVKDIRLSSSKLTKEFKALFGHYEAKQTTSKPSISFDATGIEKKTWFSGRKKTGNTRKPGAEIIYDGF